ncbi:MAG: glycosyltransferase family 2 protein [Actinobacteria bacterium]|nr:MAG: glycosyltransferase family 2 protein [Actinomycetota bacterium]
MILEILEWVGYGILAYFIVLQSYMFFLATRSAAVLRRSHHLNRFGRVGEMLSSHRVPPVSIIIPAYNEEQGIVDAIRSMAIVNYPRLEIVITNDGSTDQTLRRLIEAFDLERVRIPYRPDIQTAHVRAIYRTHSPIKITVVDKENAGRADALNAGINAARYPYALCTDADVILDAECLVKGMRHVVEDRERTITVGGNIRPLNGCTLELGHLVEARVPKKMIPRMQVLEYLRTFITSRPAWSALNALPLVSGAFGIWKRSAVIAVGGFTSGHFGEDMDLTMKMHRYHLEKEIPYRMVYEPGAVIWTEVPDTARVLKRQRIRWHRGLMTVVKDFKGLTFNPRYGKLGMITWPGMVLFEYFAPIIEFAGWFIIPLSIYFGVLNIPLMVVFIALAYGVGVINSLTAILVDESFGYYETPADVFRIVVMALIENFGFRQLTVVWRIRALFGGKKTKTWGNMERRGVANLSAKASQARSS